MIQELCELLLVNRGVQKINIRSRRDKHVMQNAGYQLGNAEIRPF